MKKILYTDFVSTEELMEELLENRDIQKAVKRSNLCKFWGRVAGAKFASKSKPFSMLGGGVMVIACETPAVAQELMLKKTQLLVKFKPYADSLKMKVNDLRFDTKKWHNEPEA
ncbi:DUF721 domain-containing protein [bacterium]|nr:DUF721 domain-containing protein [bacterium]